MSDKADKSDKLDRFTHHARRTLALAQGEAIRLNHSEIRPEHFLLALARDERNMASQVFRELQVDSGEIIRAVEAAAGRGEYPPSDRPQLAQEAKRMIEYAVDEARSLSDFRIGTEHLLLGLVRVVEDGESISLRVLEELGLSAARIRLQVLRNVFKTPSAREQTEILAEAQPTLDDLTAAAEAGRLDPLIGRQRELERLIQILGRRAKQNALLVGEPGVGKRALIHGLAHRMAAGDVPAALLDRRLLLLELKGPSRYAAIPRLLLRQSRKLQDLLSTGTILVLDPAHKLVEHDRSFMWMQEVLNAILDKNTHQLIGVTTPADYRRYFQGEEANAWDFQPMEVAEPSPEETIAILRGIKGHYETHHYVAYADETLTAAVHLAVQHIPSRFLPDKALDLIDEAGSRVRIQQDLDDPELRAHFLLLKQVKAQKAAALDADEVDKALTLHQRELTLIEELDNLRAGSARAADPPPVTPQDVADALALWADGPWRERSPHDPMEPPR